MPRAEVGTPKYLANKMKSKGLQRLRWYCQVCEKQCRDENGFKCHMTSESHLRQMLVVGENAGRQISDYSSQFQAEFVSLLSRRFGTKRVFANKVYQEYIADKSHLHMNATRWVTLAGFVKHLGRAGIARVDETEKGWFIAWVDNSPKALAKQDAALKKERATTSDEQRERTLIAEQIERAKAVDPVARESPPEDDSKPEGLQRTEESEKITLSFAAKPAVTPASIGGGLKLNPLKSSSNPLKRANVFKSSSSTAAPSLASTPSTNASGDPQGSSKRDRPMSVAESLMYEEQERKRRKMERDGR